MVVNQFNELKIFNESDDDDTTGPIIFDLQHDEDLRLGVQPRAIEDSIQFDLAGEDHDFEAIITSRSEEHTSELQSLMRISYAVFCLKKNKKKNDDSN